MLVKKFLPLVCLLCIAISNLYSQRYLLIETINDPETVKISEGQRFEFKVKDNDEWLTGRIERIMVEENVLLFENNFFSLDRITHIRKYRPAADYISKGLMTFGTVWLAYGGIATLTTDFEFGVDTGVIGGAAIGIGYLFRKLFYKRTLKIGKRYRLKLIDTTIGF